MFPLYDPCPCQLVGPEGTLKISGANFFPDLEWTGGHCDGRTLMERVLDPAAKVPGLLWPLPSLKPGFSHSSDSV